MDKVIIDGVNVAGCFNLEEWEHCNICQELIKTIPNRHQCLTEKELRCEFYTNCYYKQLKRLQHYQAEFEYELMNDYTYDGYISPNGFTPIDVIKHIKSELKRLQAENERLKEENYGLNQELLGYKKGVQASEIIELKQALQEIRDMATLFHSVNENKDLDRFKNNILDKINSVIGAE